MEARASLRYTIGLNLILNLEQGLDDENESPIFDEDLVRDVFCFFDEDESGSIDSASNDGGSSYESSASLTKGLVSSLTSLSTSIFEGGSTKLSEEIIQSSSASSKKPPTSPQDLQSRIQNEYAVNNYLWTGKLDTSSFVSNCTFTDPTLSFVGVDKYIQRRQPGPIKRDEG